MRAPAESIRHGVKRRLKEQVPYTPRPISVFRPPRRDRGNFVIDATNDALKEAEDRKHLANRLRPR